jgi:hypothetical protein
MRPPWSWILLLVLASGPAGAEAQRFGKKLAGLAEVRLADLLAEPEAGRQVRLRGTVDAVCRNKGCWLELTQDARSVHVTFEGYSFFVPKDSSGKEVVLEGRVVVRRPPPGEVEHKEAEGATAAANRVSIEATGVELR